MVVKNGPIQKLPRNVQNEGGGVKATFGQYPKERSIFFDAEVEVELEFREKLEQKREAMKRELEAEQSVESEEDPDFKEASYVKKPRRSEVVRVDLPKAHTLGKPPAAPGCKSFNLWPPERVNHFWQLLSKE